MATNRQDWNQPHVFGALDTQWFNGHEPWIQFVTTTTFMTLISAWINNTHAARNTKLNENREKKLVAAVAVVGDSSSFRLASFNHCHHSLNSWIPIPFIGGTEKLSLTNTHIHADMNSWNSRKVKPGKKIWRPPRWVAGIKKWKHTQTERIEKC